MGLTGLLLLLCRIHVFVHCVSFDTPPPGGVTIEIREDAAAGSSIYPLQATDPFRNIPVFEIISPNPTHFRIDHDSDSLILPSQGLDAEINKEFVFKFRVTAGSATAESGPLTVRVTDINDNDPVFQLTGEIWKNDPAGTRIVTVKAMDPDVSRLPITYSIAGVQTTFSVDTTGVITLADPAGLTSLSSPTVLQVEASDGGRTGTAAVIITIRVDPCSSSPCMNGGICDSNKQDFSCTCLLGYHGTLCESDFCSASPCKNGATCTSLSTGYTCDCPRLRFSPNCTCVLTVPRNIFRKQLVENSPDDTEIHTFQNVYRCSTSYEANVNITLTSPSKHFRIDGRRLLASGLDAERQQVYRLNVRFTAGQATADSGLLTVRVTDVNEIDPVFQEKSYTGEIWKNDPAGTGIVAVSAIDPDISKLTIKYSIVGSQTAFSVDNSGMITLVDPAGLTFLSSLTVLQVQASDGKRTGTAVVTITIHDDPCSTSPCKNGGTCDSTRQNFRCTCLGGYTGNLCESVHDFCAASPCKNGGTCTSHSTGYTCDCPRLHFSPNCTCVLRVPRYIFPKQVAENSPDDTEIHTFHNVYRCSTSYEANVDITLTSQSNNFRMDGRRLLASGLDAERQQVYRLRFRVTVGTATADIGPLTVLVTDVNDNNPVFQRTPYTGEIWKNDHTGKSIVTVSATDSDVSKQTITYSIVGPQTAFSVDKSGVITLADPVGLTFPLSSRTVLQVQASDGRRTGNTFVTITIHDKPCSSSPCHNGGSCTSYKQHFSCYCIGGYHGKLCELDFCSSSPCKNGGTCTSHGTGTTCECTPLHLAPDCRCVVTLPRAFTTKEVTENCPVDTEIYTFQNVYNCSASYEAYVSIRLTPPSSKFRMDGLRLLASGLDAESQQFYRLNFRVNVGTVTVDSGPLVVQVTDVNDNNPEFQWPSYAGEVWKNDPAGTRIVTMKATDRDVSKSPIRYSMNGAQRTFSVNNSSGVITLADPAGLTSLSSKTELQVQASDGGRTGTSSVTITIYDDPCSSSPCRNGGTCDSDRQDFSCACLSGYSGPFCESEAASISDYCYASPCKNGATCSSHSSGYTCDCAPLYFSPNCACVLTVPRNRITIRVKENFPDDTEMYTFRNVYNCSTIFEANVNISLTSPSTHFRMDGMRLLASGLDAERQRVYRLYFRVTAGSASANIGPLKIRVLDVNDISPVFDRTAYTGNIRKHDPTGTWIVTVEAKDHDISNLPITYTIVDQICRQWTPPSRKPLTDARASFNGIQWNTWELTRGAQTTFSVDNSSGVITLADPAGLTSLSSPTVLQVQASDGGRTATVAVNITILGTDSCKPGICRHGGTCIDGVDSYTCVCVPNYVGDNCETNLIAKAYWTLGGGLDHSEISKTINVTCFREDNCVKLRKNRDRFTSAEACCTGEVGGFTVQTSERQGRNAYTCTSCAEWRRNFSSIRQHFPRQSLRQLLKKPGGPGFGMKRQNLKGQ